MPASPFDSQQQFLNETFADLDLEGVNLSEKEFERCVFRHCKLPASIWVRARLEECRFEQCDLSRMVPTHAQFTDVRFDGTRLLGVQWSDLGLLPDVGFENCDLRYASFVKLKLPRTAFTDCTLREATFEQTDLTSADFSGSDLTGTTFARCELGKTDFRSALGVLFDPMANKVKGVRVSLDAAAAYLQTFGIEVS